MKRKIVLILSLMMFILSAAHSFAEEDIKIASEQKYMPTNLYIIGATDNLVISWRNPQAETLTEVKFFDISGTAEYEITEFDIFDTDAKEVKHKTAIPAKAYIPICIKQEELREGEYKKYKIVSSFSDHEDTEFIFSRKVMASSLGGIAGWGREIYSGVLGYSPINEYVYTGEAHTGNACMRICSNNPGAGNNYLTHMQSVPFEHDKKYKVSFWTKSSYGSIAFFNNWDYANRLSYSNTTGEMTDWVQTVGTYSSTNSTIFRMNVEGQSDFFLIDDIEVYELDENGEPTGDNLAQNGSFESGITSSSRPPKPSGCKVSTDTPDVVTLSWDEIDDDTKKIMVYKMIGGEYIKVAEAANNENSFDIYGLTPGEPCTVALTLQDSTYNESDYVTFDVIPKTTPYKVSDIVLKKGNKTVDKISSGILTVTTTVKNNDMGDDFSAELLAALYKNGALYKIYSSKQAVIPRTPPADDPQKLSVNISMPNDISSNDYTMEVFIWDSHKNMAVLAPHTVFNK